MNLSNLSFLKSPSCIFYLEKENKFLAIDQETFGWAIIGKLGKTKLEFLSSGKNLRDALNNGISQKEIMEFYDAGLLMIDGKTEYKPIIQKETRVGLCSVVLHTSNACNLRCTYCYSNASKGKPMNFEVAKNVIDKLENYGNKHINIEFHGGEPLLNFELIKRVVEYASKKYLFSGEPKFCYSIQTNATLLTKEIVSFFKKNKFDVGTSLDGLISRNNQTRIYPNGQGAYKDIINGIRLLQENEIPFSTIAVIKDINAIDEIYPFMIETKISNIKLANYFKQGRAIEDAEVLANMQEYGSKVLNLTDKFVQHNLSSDFQLKIGDISVMLNNILSRKRNYMCMRFPCGAGDSIMGIDIDGSVYPCEEMNGKRELIVGEIVRDDLEKILNSPINRELRTRQTNKIEDCPNCPFVSVCEVSCANHSYNKSKNFYSKSDNCEYYKVIIPGLIWRMNKNPKGMKTLI